MSARRKRIPMTAKVTSLSIGEGVYVLAGGLPDLRELRGREVDEAAHALDGTRGELVRQRTDDERADDVARDDDRDDGRLPPADDLVQRRRGHGARLAAGARDGVVAVRGIDDETSAADADRVVELAYPVGLAH